MTFLAKACRPIDKIIFNYLLAKAALYKVHDSHYQEHSMTRWPGRRTRWLLVAIATVLGVFGHADGAVDVLLPGVPVEREIEPNGVDRYEVSLAAGDFLRLRVEQKEFEVGATILGPDERPVFVASGISTPTSSLPSFTIAAVIPTGGRYRVEIRVPSPAFINARYRLRLDPPRPATGADKQAAEASRTFHEGTQFALQARANQPRLTEYMRKAAEPYRAAVERFNALGDREGEASALQNLGWAYHDSANPINPMKP